VFWLRTRDKLPTPMEQERTKQAFTLLRLPQFSEKTGAQMYQRDSDMSKQERWGDNKYEKHLHLPYRMALLFKWHAHHFLDHSCYSQLRAVKIL